MSYILDALKKAEAERHQGAVPTLHVQPAAALPADIDSSGGRKRLVLLAGGMLLAVSGILAATLASRTRRKYRRSSALPAARCRSAGYVRRSCGGYRSQALSGPDTRTGKTEIRHSARTGGINGAR